MKIRSILLAAGFAALLANAAIAQQADPHHPEKKQLGQEQTNQEQTGQQQTAPGAGQTMNQGMMGHAMMGQMMGQNMMGQGGMMGMMGRGGMMGMMGQGGSAMSGMMANMSQMMGHMSEMMKGMEAGAMASQPMNMGQPKGDQGPASQAFAKANAEMHAGMAIEYSGNVEVDFVKGMIPHHQGAVAMAKILLENGKDPELRKLAEDIVAAQEKEIAFMNEWLKKQGK